MHTMWKGSISFGLVNIPVKMYAATEEKPVRFRSLHKECQTPIKMERTCPKCKKEVPWSEVVKGYEYQEDRFVVMEKEELEKLLPDQGKTIEILDFVDLKEIDPIYYQKTYYLGAQDAKSKAYALLRKALQDSQKIAIAQITIRSKQTLAVVRVYRDCLVMETIFYPDEVRDVGLVPDVPQDLQLNEKEVMMANQLIEQLTTAFDPSKYQDEYRLALEEVIEKKIQGEEIVEVKEVRDEKVVDLMEALKASLEAAKKKPPEEEQRASS
ncbi:Ku protein [Shimazuella sp. AN120528]|uniref:non-homologous end joining protein Ku n=1 Tax=Shimazuella soli TaxID=1892854 RepID=UPI001F0E965C|nr:Ku protein [Shimazuella soli]MCH5585486.1 Ku protein [Shimazuella soli]